MTSGRCTTAQGYYNDSVDRLIMVHLTIGRLVEVTNASEAARHAPPGAGLQNEAALSHTLCLGTRRVFSFTFLSQVLFPLASSEQPATGLLFSAVCPFPQHLDDDDDE